MYESNHVINNCLDPSLFNFEIPNLENGKHVLRLQNIWIPRYTKTKQHYVRFYCQGWRVCYDRGQSC